MASVNMSQPCKRKVGRPAPLHLPLRTLATSNTILSPSNIHDFRKMNSPMTNLTLNLSELSTGRGTPRRKLSLSSLDTPTTSVHPTPERSISSESSESGCFMDSPTPLDSPTLEMSMQRFAKVKPEIPIEAFSKKKTIAFRRIQSMPVPAMRFSPDMFNKENECSGNTDLESDLGFHGDEEKPEPSVQSSFAMASFESRLSEVRGSCFMDENSSQDSGVSLERDRDFSNAHISPPPNACSESPLKICPYLGSDDEEEEQVDDGFLDVMDQEVAEINHLPGSMAKLFSAPVLNKESHSPKDEETPIIRRAARRFLRRSQSVDVRSRPFSFKRDPPTDENTPVQNKRQRRPIQEDDHHGKSQLSKQTPPKPKLHRCHSETEAVIKSALNRLHNEPDLIADCSKPYCLPIIPGKHQDLKCIAPQTVMQLLDNEYSHVIEKFMIVDCRYPYEYEGGHIRGAKNIYTQEGIIEEFLKTPIPSTNPEKSSILIFHCEFSSERAPKLSRFLRKKDRDTNKECYPALHYPEVYLLHGGYKDFFSAALEYCEPQSYKPMLHKDHSQDLRHFRTKSKSWAGEKPTRPGFRPLF
ncbi:hypothetical protein KUTeg_004977 [Tegillarca granosa]|uniref:M-phase inducer phosphatase n=1 Tax=Tegillarca granosa TaxID=220873 RepID=A0ABQ9FIF4_TEGGR|nr:hypothetical protein KUTeg_004977 [Tegillarca granosa]